MDLPPQFDIASLRELLERQAGLVSTGQLRDLGLDARVARRWVAAGRWQRPHRGVFAAFSGPLDRTAHVWAAILWATPEAVASHATAAELDGLTGRLDDNIHVTAPVSRRVRSRAEGVVVHYAHRLPLTRHPTANPPRTRLEDTLLDLVDTTSRARDVESWVTMAVQKRLTTSTRLADALMRRKKIRWRAMVEAMLVDVAEGAQSPLELRHLRAVERAHQLPAGSGSAAGPANGSSGWTSTTSASTPGSSWTDASAMTARAGSVIVVATTPARCTAPGPCATGTPRSSVSRAGSRRNRRVSCATAAGPAGRSGAAAPARSDDHVPSRSLTRREGT